MFGLFKKKKEDPKPAQTREQDPIYKEFAADFPAEVTDILAVTGASGFSAEQVEGTDLWKASMGVTAWKDEYTQELKQGEARLEVLGDDQLLSYLRDYVPRDFIIQLPVRPSADGTRFLMLDLPKPAFDPELKAILDKQKEPVTLEVDGLGTFTFSRTMSWFQTEIDWADQAVQLVFDRSETQEDSIQTALALTAEAADWDVRVKEFAAGQLVDQVNEWLQESGESFDCETLAARLEIDTVLAAEEGRVEFWMHDEEMLFPQTIHVTGTLTDGPMTAGESE